MLLKFTPKILISLKISTCCTKISIVFLFRLPKDFLHQFPKPLSFYWLNSLSASFSVPFNLVVWGLQKFSSPQYFSVPLVPLFLFFRLSTNLQNGGKGKAARLSIFFRLWFLEVRLVSLLGGNEEGGPSIHQHMDTDNSLFSFLPPLWTRKCPVLSD